MAHLKKNSMPPWFENAPLGEAKGALALLGAKSVKYPA